MQPPTHEEIEAVTPLLSSVLFIAKWVGGPAAVAWIVARFLVKSSVKVGEKKREYEDLVDDVEAIKAREKEYITLRQHEVMQRNCTATLDGIINTKINSALAGVREEMNVMNGNICRIMGALDIQPDQAMPHKRRKTDVEP